MGTLLTKGGIPTLLLSFGTKLLLFLRRERSRLRSRSFRDRVQKPELHPEQLSEPEEEPPVEEEVPLVSPS